MYTFCLFSLVNIPRHILCNICIFAQVSYQYKLVQFIMSFVIAFT